MLVGDEMDAIVGLRPLLCIHGTFPVVDVTELIVSILGKWQYSVLSDVHVHVDSLQSPIWDSEEGYPYVAERTWKR